MESTLTNATVYFDATSDPRNPGWVCETNEGGNPQYAMDSALEASDDELIAEAKRYADGEISIRRS